MRLLCDRGEPGLWQNGGPALTTTVHWEEAGRGGRQGESPKETCGVEVHQKEKLGKGGTGWRNQPVHGEEASTSKVPPPHSLCRIAFEIQPRVFLSESPTLSSW